MFDPTFQQRQAAFGEGGGGGGFGALSTAVSGSVGDSSLRMRGKEEKANSWYEALAQAWGDVLNKQAADIESRADAISNGSDQPKDLLLLSAQAQRFGFTSNNASTSTNSVGEALQTLGKKSS